MNFSEFSESYDKTSKKKFAKVDKKQKAEKRGDTPGDKNAVSNVHPYNVIGKTGMDGDGYAWEEEIGANMNAEMNEGMVEKSDKDRKRDEDEALRHKVDDDRMRYGKKGKNYMDDTALRPGEVRKWDKVNKTWVSNKD